MQIDSHFDNFSVFFSDNANCRCRMHSEKPCKHNRRMNTQVKSFNSTLAHFIGLSNTHQTEKYLLLGSK